MSEEAQRPGFAGPWPMLDVKARRVLGVLIEKAKTTPDAYPLTLNALVTGCNQKSNRDPILNLDEAEVEETLRQLKAHAIVVKVFGGRTERWRHLLYETWNVDKIELAILGELLLRGPQSEGELRGRAHRMEPIEDLDTLRARVRPLVERKLVVYLTPEERRGALLTHGFHAADELERLKVLAASAPAAVAVAAAGHSSPSAPTSRQDDRVSELVTALDTLRQELAEVKEMARGWERTIADLRSRLTVAETELATLKQSLGG